jgi:hypothetical protein
MRYALLNTLQIEFAFFLVFSPSGEVREGAGG